MVLALHICRQASGLEGRNFACFCCATMHSRHAQHNCRLRSVLCAAGLHPFPYHVANVSLHAMVSLFVLMLANYLYNKLEQLTMADSRQQHRKSATSDCKERSSSTTKQIESSSDAVSQQSRTSTTLKRRKGTQQASIGAGQGHKAMPPELQTLSPWLMWQQQPSCWQLQGSSKVKVQAVLAALLFALHPIHTEVSHPPHLLASCVVTCVWLRLTTC